MSAALNQVSYQQFRDSLSKSNRVRVVHKRGRTMIYEGWLTLKAMIVAAEIDPRGRCWPPIYYVRA